MNVWIKQNKKLFSWTISLLVFMWIFVAVAANGNPTVYAKETCTLSVMIQNKTEESSFPVAGIEVDICQIASLDDSGEYQLTDSFLDSGVVIEELADYNAENAAVLKQYIMVNDIPYQTQYTDASGRTMFSSLKQGIYVVFGAGNQSVNFHPYVIILPSIVDGNLLYHVESRPKTSDQPITDGDLYKNISVTKIWDDNEDKAGKRPESITVTLYRDSIAYRKTVLDSSNGWKHTFKLLPASGRYSVAETSISNYKASYSGTETTGFTITNRYQSPGGGGPVISDVPIHTTGSLSVKKVWDDDNNRANARPESITVQLIQNGKVVETVTLNHYNQWQYIFTGLSENGRYTVKEITPKDYSANYTGNIASGYVITNRYTEGITDPGEIPDEEEIPKAGETDISVEKVWDDANDVAGKRPEKITVQLIANSSVYRTVTLSSRNGWKSVFEDVPDNLAYTVLEKAVSDYTATYSGNTYDGFTITNQYTEDTTDPGTPLEPTKPKKPNRADTPGQSDKTKSSEPGKGDKPTIPQTGLILWPIYLMIALGLLMIILGSGMMLSERDRDD
ncbi:MAG: Cna B-type domain-containing protein [Lachnospiraceae bacterium]